MSKKSKRRAKSNSKIRKNQTAQSQLSAILPPGAKPVDHMAFQIMLKYVNGTDATDIRRIVENSYRMADQFETTFNERHNLSE